MVDVGALCHWEGRHVPSVGATLSHARAAKEAENAEDACQGVPRRLERFVHSVVAMHYPNATDLMKRVALLIAFALVAGCSDPEAVCSLDDSEWVGPDPECTDEERAENPYGSCDPRRITFRGCEYVRLEGDQVIKGTYTASGSARFHFMELGQETDGFLQDGGDSLAAPGGGYVHTSDRVVPWF